MKTCPRVSLCLGRVSNVVLLTLSVLTWGINSINKKHNIYKTMS